MRPTKEELREYDTAELNFKKSLGDIPFSEIQKKTQDFKNKWFSGQKEPVVQETVVEVKEEPVEEPEEGEIVEDTPEEKSSDEEIPY